MTDDSSVAASAQWSTMPSDAPPVPRGSNGRAAAAVIVGMAGAGVVVGALWGWLAPPVHGVYALTRAGERVQTYLGDEADHFFVAAFLMLGMLWVVSVIAPVLVWQWRARRGPVMVAALTVGAVAAAAVATTVGTFLVRARYPALDIDAAPVSPEHRVHYYTQAPSAFFGQGSLEMAATLLVPAATAALVYALFAVAAVRDDLGGYPPIEPRAVAPTSPMLPTSAVEPRQR